MKNIKKIILFLFLLTSTITITACAKKPKNTTIEHITTNQQAKLVTVKSIEASYPSTAKMLKAYNKIKPEDTLNYYVIFQDDNMVRLTITVDNPEEVQITMLDIECSDEDAQIKVWDNGEEVWQNLSTQSYVGWNGSSVYVTTYDIKVSNIDEAVVRVRDIKIETKWQKEHKIGNNELHIYRVNVSANVDLIRNEEISEGIWEAEFIVNEIEGVEIAEIRFGNGYGEVGTKYTIQYGLNSDWGYIDYPIGITYKIELGDSGIIKTYNCFYSELVC